jgi:hypothetical protein
MDAPVAIACLLDDKELQRRRSDHLDKAGKLLTGERELPNGIEYSFRIQDDIVALLAEIISLERKCCPFLDMAMFIRSGEDDVSLTLSGPDGTKEAVRSLFAWSENPSSVHSRS